MLIGKTVVLPSHVRTNVVAFQSLIVLLLSREKKQRRYTLSKKSKKKPKEKILSGVRHIRLIQSFVVNDSPPEYPNAVYVESPRHPPSSHST